MPKHFNELVQNNEKLSKVQCSAFLLSGPFLCMQVNYWTVLCFWEFYHLTSSVSCMCLSMCVFFPVCTVMTRRSDRCCKHKPVSLEDRPATQAEKNTLFALEINRCITSHLRLLEARRLSSPPAEDFGHNWAATWETIGHCYDCLSHGVVPFK